MSVINQLEVASNDEVKIVKTKRAPRKVLEEEEYLSRMAKIIRRDFFPDPEFPLDDDISSTNPSTSHRSNQTYNTTPATDRTQFSSTSSMRSRRAACSTSLNRFLEKYTSEDNAYFEKLQRKELRRHRAKYPWLYKDKGGHNKGIQHQLKLPSLEEQAAIGGQDSSMKMIGWPHNPKNGLFYAPELYKTSKRPQSTINYNSNRYINERLFKEPLPLAAEAKPKTFKGSSDKIGIDGKLVNGIETPIVNIYPPLLPTTETVPNAIIEEPKFRLDSNKFYIPHESPRDELAHRLYEEKVAKVIRTPRTGPGGTPKSTTPFQRKSFVDFSFSPERIRTPGKSN